MLRYISWMELILLEERALYKRTRDHVRKSYEKKTRLLSQHQNEGEMLRSSPLYIPQNKPTVSKMDSATEPSRSRRSGT